MTKLLDEAVDTARGLPPDAQDDVARVVLQLVREEPAIALSPEEQVALARSKAAARAGRFATDEQVRAVWSKYGL